MTKLQVIKLKRLGFDLYKCVVVDTSGTILWVSGTSFSIEESMTKGRLYVRNHSKKS
jgi:hypothetical protein